MFSCHNIVFGKYRHRKLGKQYCGLDVVLMLKNFRNINVFITIKYFTECFSIYFFHFLFLISYSFAFLILSLGI